MSNLSYKTIAEVGIGKDAISLLLDIDSKVAYIVRSDCRAIDSFSVWAWGWGDCTSFELSFEDETLILKEASFCRYNGYTEIAIYKYKNIMTDEIAIELIYDENIQGRKEFSINATRLLNN